MELKVIQDIKVNDYIELEPVIPMYCRGSVPIQTVEDGSAKLRKNEGFDFLTYFNSLPIGKWRKYTNCDKYYLVLDIKGTFNLDMFGHLQKDKNYQKEWVGRFFYDIEERKKITIAIPNNVQSDVVSFGIGVIEDTYVYDAYYAAEIDEKFVKKPSICLVTNVSENVKTVHNNVATLNEDFFNTIDFGKSVKWIISDKNGIMDDDIANENIIIYRESDDPSKLLTKKGYVIVIDESVSINADSLKRIYVFLSLIKDKYKEFALNGAILENEKQNIQADIYFKNKDVKETFIESTAFFKNTDLGLWLNVINNESGYAKKYFPGLFYCVPAKDFSFKELLHSEDISGTGYTLLRPADNSISLSGVCAWTPDIKERLEASRIEDKDGKKLLKLQDIVLNGDIEIEVTKSMYYRSDGKIILNKGDDDEEDRNFIIENGFYYDFFTYFNAFSLEKWEKYTYINNVYLMIEAKGDFSVTLFGHYKSKVGFPKEWFGNYHYNLTEKEKVIIPYPRGMQSELISFVISADHDVRLYKACYITEIDKSKINNPIISMVTTTFKKEKFIERNIVLLTEGLLSDPDYDKHFHWYIIDNGRSVETPDDLNERIKIIPNKNVGGAGGFARGQIEALKGDKKTTHILFMDDDVVFIPDSFKKLCNFLKILKDEYQDYFVSGSMLKTGQPNIQHENTAWLNDYGNNESLKTNLDLNLWDAIISNEEINENIPNRYAAFWFCCVPTTVATMDNLPLPVFFRGDDIEYSLRNKAKIITMNGLCIWHEGFEGRFSASLDFYLTVRNKLMLCTINPHLSGIDMIGNIEKNFWDEMRKFDYKGAAFFLDAIEDFLKGPKFYKETDGEANMKQKKAADNKMQPINPEIRSMINYDKLYWAKPLRDEDSERFELTCNEQDISTEITAGSSEGSDTETNTKSKTIQKEKVGIIPYGWGTWPSKVYKADEVIAVDPANDTYVIYKKDVKEYKKLKTRFEKLMKSYKKNGEDIIKAYQDSRAEMSNVKFWDKYLQ